MSVFTLFRHRGSAPVARERLQILLSHERATRGQRDLLGILQEEILTAIAKHVAVERDNVQVQMDRGDTVSTLEINVEIPHSTGMTIRATGSNHWPSSFPPEKRRRTPPRGDRSQLQR